MALELTMRHGTVRPPLLVVPTPDFKSRYHRQDSSDTPLSPTDTPRKNKRKLSEPKRRTTDFSIKRFCPDSPGSACSESGRSEESGHDESRDSVECSASPTDMSLDKDRLLQHHPHLRPPFVYPELPHHPYLIPPFYYGRMPGFPSPLGSHMHGHPEHPGLPTVHSASVSHPPAQQHSRSSSQDSSTKSCVTPSPSPSAPRHVQKKKDKHVSVEETPTRETSPKRSLDNDEDESSPESPRDSKKCRKNYKNMTRERRVEANARERTRVHTISAAFEGLRRAVPSYSYNQKLSKLAILRIACSYINALSKLADPDGENPQLKNSSFADCVDNCTRTIQTEGKARRRH